MKTFITLLAIFSIALFYTSCNDEGSILTPGNETGGIEQTFTGTASGYVDPEGPAPDFSRHMEGEGTNTLFGDCDVMMDYFIQSFNPATGAGSIWNAKGELTDKRNGMKIFAVNGTGTFQFTGNTMTSTSTAIISGGTGKYSKMSGTMTFTGTMNATTRFMTVNWTVTYSYKKQFGGEFFGDVYPQTTNCGLVPPFNLPTSGREGDGTGPLVHMGESTGDFAYCVGYAGTTEGIIVPKAGAVNTITADNGDQINLTCLGGLFKVVGTQIYNGQTYIKVIGTNYMDITSGTGRFVNADGIIHCEVIQLMTLGQPNMDPAIAWATWYGSWTY